MKKLIILFLLLNTFFFLYSFSDSILLSNRFMMKTNGFSALKTNPANIDDDAEIEYGFGFLNWNLQIENNSFTLNDYNTYNGKFLDQDLKDEILKKIDGSLKINVDFNFDVFGFHTRHFAYLLSMKAVGKGHFSKDYLDLMLNGNEFNHEYHFGNDTNDAEFVSYLDFNIGYNRFSLQDILNIKVIDDLPKIRVGYGLSALVGLGHFKIIDYSGMMVANNSGFSLNQSVKAKTSVLGFGLKGHNQIQLMLFPHTEHLFQRL